MDVWWVWKALPSIGNHVSVILEVRSSLFWGRGGEGEGRDARVKKRLTLFFLLHPRDAMEKAHIREWKMWCEELEQWKDPLETDNRNLGMQDLDREMLQAGAIEVGFLLLSILGIRWGRLLRYPLLIFSLLSPPFFPISFHSFVKRC